MVAVRFDAGPGADCQREPYRLDCGGVVIFFFGPPGFPRSLYLLDFILETAVDLRHRLQVSDSVDTSTAAQFTRLGRTAFCANTCGRRS